MNRERCGIGIEKMVPVRHPSVDGQERCPWNITFQLDIKIQFLSPMCGAGGLHISHIVSLFSHTEESFSADLFDSNS
jgi:hypothetical protein